MRNFYEELMALLAAATDLRRAQIAYMADRGNDQLGKAVANAAEKLDHVISDISGRLFP